MKYCVNEQQPQNLQELQDYITKEWMNISQEEVVKCISDLRATLHAVIAAEGRHVTKAEKKQYKIKVY